MHPVTRIIIAAMMGMLFPLALRAAPTTPKTQANTPPVSSKTQLHPGKFTPTSEVYLSDDNILIVEVYIGKEPTGQNIEIYQYDGGFLVPLEYLTRLLDFPIQVDAESGEAHGWFIRENRIFDLNMKRQEVISDGIKKPYDPSLIQTYYGDIYVDYSLFSTWFPVDLQLNFPDLILYMNPREKLPIQEKLEREARRKNLLRIAPQKKIYPKVPTAYQAYSMPLADINIGYNYDKSVGKGNMPFSASASGDLGYMNTDIFTSGSSLNSFQALRVGFSRKDYTGNLLGPMNATEFRVGDINGVSLPLVSQSNTGRGAYISNYALDRGNKFDSKDFIGDAPPGWEVELYRNGVLLDSQTVPDSGRYQFLDIPVLFGNNSFRTVTYGPQGEIHEKTENYLIGDSFIPKGKLQYQLAMDEESKTLFGVDERDSTILHKHGARATANIEYGLTDNTTATLGFVRAPLRDNRFHHYQMLGLRQSFGKVLASSNAIYDMNDQSWATQLQANTSINNVSIHAEQQLMNNFVSEVLKADQLRRKSYSLIDINGMWRNLLPTGLTYRFAGDYERKEGNNNVTSFNNRLSTNLMGLSFTNNIDWRKTSNVGDTNILTTGDFSIRGYFKQILLRTSLNYNLHPDSSLQSALISGQRRLSKDLSLRADLRHDFNSNGLTSITTALNKTFDGYRLSTSLQADDGGNYAIGTTLSISLGQEPRSGKLETSPHSFASYGAASARAFLDKNHDGVFDDNDEYIPDVAFRVDNHLVHGDGNKPVFLPGIRPDLPADITVEQASIEDPFWMPVPEGYSIISHPGLVSKVDFPVVITTEIDGTIYTKRGEKTNIKPGVAVELVDKKSGKVVSTAHSEFDGFFLFQKVISGTYFLRINAHDLALLGATEDHRIELEIPEGSDTISNQDIIIPLESHEDDKTAPQDSPAS